jgi:hypothetical protein
LKLTSSDLAGDEVPMSWEVNDQEFKTVLSLSAPRRYEYLVKRSASHGELWGLRDDDGWVMAEDDDAKTHFPVWPHPRFAEACATGPWEESSPGPVAIDDWVEAWLPNLTEEGFRIAVFQTPNEQGVSVSPERPKRDLDEELSLFGP